MNKKKDGCGVGEGRDVRFVCFLLFVIMFFLGCVGPVQVFSAPVNNVSLEGGLAQNIPDENVVRNKNEKVNKVFGQSENKLRVPGMNGETNKDINKNGLTYYPVLINYSQKTSKGGVVVNVVNPAASSYLLQGNISVFDPATGRAGNAPGTGKMPPFVVLPPLSRLEASGRTALRVRQVGSGLPADRESAAVVSVLAVPPQDSAAITENGQQAGEKKGGVPRLQIALRMNMLLFWRPEGVADPVPGQVAKALTFHARENGLEVKNPTPYFVHFSALSVGGSPVPESARAAWVSPMSSHTFSLARTVSSPIVWTLTGEKDEHQTGL